jgi:hypothetical protein
MGGKSDEKPFFLLASQQCTPDPNDLLDKLKDALKDAKKIIPALKKAGGEALKDTGVSHSLLTAASHAHVHVHPVEAGYVHQAELKGLQSWLPCNACANGCRSALP